MLTSFLFSAQPIVAALVAISCSAFWATATAQPRGGERGGPPAEALSACKTLAAGDACSFSGRRGEVSGSCWAPADKPLACRTAGGPGPAGERPAR